MFSKGILLNKYLGRKEVIGRNRAARVKYLRNTYVGNSMGARVRA